jgi:hypothetical protein
MMDDHMRPSQAAAIALIGWYLMVPPQADHQGTLTTVPDTAAPLGTWTVEHSFDTAAECEKRLNQWRAQGHAQEKSKDGTATWDINRRIAANCIATDDPRLK